MTPRFCGQCGKPVHADDRGERRCENGHPQTDAAQLVAAMRDLVPVLRDVRADIVQALEDQGVEFRSLREEVEALRAEPAAAEYNDLATEALRIGRSRDWLRDHAADLGGRQPGGKRGHWQFRPAVTDARLAALEDGPSGDPARWQPPARPLPSKVPLLDVKGRAA